MTKKNKAVDEFEEANREYLALGPTPEARLRRSGLRMCDAIRKVEGWRNIPSLVSRLENERFGFVILRDHRRRGFKLPCP